MAGDNTDCNTKKLNANKVFLQKAFSCLNIDACTDLDIAFEILVNKLCTLSQGGSSLVDNGDGTFTFTDNNGVDITVDYKRATVLNNGDGTFTITDDFGTVINIDINETTTTITNTVSGNRIATYTNEDAVAVDIFETITTLTNNGGGSYSYRSEDGTVTNFTTTSGVSTDEGNILTLGTDSLPYLSDTGLLANIGNTDLTIDTAGVRKLILGGGLSSDKFAIRNSADSADLINFRGDSVIEQKAPTIIAPSYTLANGDLTLRPSTSSPNSRALGILTATNTEAIQVSSNAVSGHKPVYIFDRVLNTATGTHRVIEIDSDSGSGLTNNRIIEIDQSSASATNVGLYLNVRNGTSNNYAIDIVNGDINTSGGIGLSATYTFGGGASGDVASMTFTKGVLTAVTTVP